ncbi:MAG: HEPN family nuclease [Bacteroidales bacterium]
MEYFRDPRNQIYADFAYRIGKIVIQYERIKINEEKFEATLYLAALKNLMTICNEYVREMTRTTRRDSVFRKDLESAGWGLRNECWVKNTFREEQNLQNFIRRIRNSVSHPTQVQIDSDYPSTGFTTLKDDSGVIKEYRFINSPDTENNRVKLFHSEDKILKYIKKNKDEFPLDITYGFKQEGRTLNYYLVSNSKEYARISIIDLTVLELGFFVRHLANYLAQPIQENWDGMTIKELLVA